MPTRSLTPIARPRPLLGRARLLALVLLAGLAALPAACGEAEVASGELVWITPERGVALEPAAAFDAGGRLWVAWLAWRPGEKAGAGDEVRLLAATLRDGAVGEPLVVSDEPGLAVPVLAPHGDGVMCAFETEGGVWTVELVPDARGDAAPGRARTRSRGGRSPALAGVAGSRDTEIVWQELEGEHYVLRSKRWIPSKLFWKAQAPFPEAEGDRWNPRVAIGPDGSRHFAWDEWNGASFDVRYARLGPPGDPGDPGDPDDRGDPGDPDESGEPGAELLALAIADGPTYQGFPSLSVDGEGEAWIAYEEAPGFGEGGPLRESRALRLASVLKGRVFHYDVDELGGGLPRVLAARHGVLVTSRALDEAFSSVEGQRTTNFNAWATRVTRFDRDAGAVTETEERIEGDAEATEVLVESPEGEVWCVFAADGRSAEFEGKHGFDDPIEGRWRVGALRLRAPDAWPAGSVRPVRSERAPTASAPPTSGRTAARAASGWLFGDLHRHTQLSRCSGAQDGTLADVYRYARGPGALDFVAVTDHFQHLTPWSWWRSLRDAERWYAPGSLVTFAAIERNVGGQGHHNLVYRAAADARGDEAAWSLGGGGRAGPRAQPPPPSALDGEHVIAIPHMMSTSGNPFRWERARPDLFGLVEVYQGNRGSYEGFGLPYQAKELTPGAPDLARGIRLGRLFGLIASSDHSSSATAFAGVRAEELTREAVFDALRRRETLAATSFAAAETRLGEFGPGGFGPVAADAPFELELGGGLPVGAAGEPVPLAYVEVVKNGALWKRLDGSSAQTGELVPDVPDVPGARGTRPRAARELFVFTTRHRRAREGRPLEIGVAGGRILRAAPRLAGETGVRVLRASASLVAVTLEGGSADVLLEVERDAAGADGRPAPLEFSLRFASQGATVSGDDVPPGRSLRFDGLSPQLEYLWRLGEPLGAAGPFRVAYEDPERAAGDSYYARVVWADGNVVWTSPIRVERVVAQ